MPNAAVDMKAVVQVHSRLRFQFFRKNNQTPKARVSIRETHEGNVMQSRVAATVRTLMTTTLVMATVIMAIPPHLAKAQAFDPDTRAAVEMLAKQVANRVVLGIDLPQGQATVHSSLTPAIEKENEAEEGPEAKPATVPEVDSTELVEYTNQGVTIQAPASWNVELSQSEFAVFYIDIPGTDFFIGLQPSMSLNIPSLVGMAFFRSQPEGALEEFADAEVVDSTTLYSSQGLPIVKLAFSGVSMGEEVSGGFYLTSPNESLYTLIASGPPEQWEQVAENLQMVAESIVFDEEVISLTSIGDEPTRYTDGGGRLEVEAPAGWYAIEMDDPIFKVILSEPEVRFTVAVAAGEDLDESLNPSMLEQFELSGGELSAEEQEALIADVIEIVMDASADVELDEETATMIVRENAVTVRVQGMAELQADQILPMPVEFFVDLRTTGSAVAAVLGDLDAASEKEAEIQALVESVTGL
jgi:hypothetical protein